MILSNKFVAGLLLGAAAATAAVLFLQSEKGKEILSDIEESAEDVGENIKSRWQNLEGEIDELVKKGKKFVADLEKKAKDAASSI